MHGLATLAFAATGVAALALCDDDQVTHDSLPTGKVCSLRDALSTEQVLPHMAAGAVSSITVVSLPCKHWSSSRTARPGNAGCG